MLIVCEGGKTEPNYFGRLCRVYSLSSANIRVIAANGTDPMSVVGTVERELAMGDYNRAYCVFDRDGHTNYTEALHRIAQLNGVTAIPSVPCFEIWILLHFGYSTRPFNPSKVSACEQVLSEIKKHFPKYAKGYPDVFDHLVGKLDQAIKHAIRLEAHNVGTGSSNPGTQIHRLVDYLRKLKI